MKARGKILIADDDDDLRRIYRIILSKDGWAIVEATTGAEAIMQIKDEAPDIIILDYRMPEIDGEGVMRWLRGNFEQCRIPVIYISAVSNLEELAKMHAACLHLSKPFSLGQLRQKLDVIKK